MKGQSLRRKLGFVLLFSFLLMILVYPSSQNLKTVSAVITTVDGLIFENGSITGYVGTNSIVTIPSSINGQAVKSVDGAFTYNEVITQVNISEGITTLTNGAFFSCPNLTSVSIPSTVFTISAGSLSACSSLSAITLSEANTSFVLADNILYNSALTEIVQHINKSEITAYTVPDTIIKIKDFAFANSANITSVQISENTTSIGIGAFASCPNLNAISVSLGNPNYKSTGGILYSADSKTLLAYPSNLTGTGFAVPTEVEILAPYSFTGCTQLSSVTLSPSVSEVKNAFTDCFTLTQVNVDVSNIYFSSLSGVLTSKDGKTLVYYPGGKTSASYTVPAIVTSLGEGAFMRHTHLETLSLQSSVTFIDNYAVWGCNSLKKITVPTTVTSFAANALTGAKNMKVWGYPNSKAEEYTGQNGIPFVAIGSSADWLFTDNGNGTCNITGYLAASNDVCVPSVINGLWVDTVEYTAFSGRTGIEYITFYESVKTIEAAKSDGTAYIFQDCSALREVYLPASLEKFQTYTAPYKPLKGCTSLINVIVDDENPSFYDTNGVLFSWDKKLLVYPSGRTATSYTIPSGTTGISYGAFENNYLKDVIVPGSVTILSKGVEPTFKNNIESVYLSEGVETVMYDAFSKTTVMDIYFPTTVTSITGTAEPLPPHTMYVYDASAPYQFAVDNGIDYVLLCVVTFNSNGGTTVPQQVVPAGYKAVEPTNVTKPKNVLLGWYTDSALTNQWSFNTVVSKSMTLYAKWVEGYPIIYNMNGGVNDKDNPSYYVSGTIVLLEDPTKDNYTFDGWYTDSSCKLEYKFEAIEKTTTGTVELWADWWTIDTSSSSESSGTIDTNALSDERKPEITHSGFPEDISYFVEGQKIDVTGKLSIKYANVEEIAVSYSGHTDKLYKYADGDDRLEVFNYAHSFEVGSISYTTQDTYIITLRLSTGEYYQHEIPVFKYQVVTEILHAPNGSIYMSSEKKYELRTMAVANDAFEILDASYISENPEICAINDDNTLKPLAAGTASIKTTIILSNNSTFTYLNDFTIVDRTVNEPHANENEFYCQCYGQYCTGLPEAGIDPGLIDLINKIRQESDAKIFIISGYRCEEYNKTAGADTGSEHVKGTAADLWSNDISLDELYEICDRLNVSGGVGRYPNYIHIDTRDAYIRWTEN